MDNVKEVLDNQKRLKKEYADIEIYSLRNKKAFNKFHTDNLDKCVYSDCVDVGNSNKLKNFFNTKVIDYELMDEEEYNHIINANNDVTDNFEELYGNKNAKILVIAIDPDEEDEVEENEEE